VENGEPKLRCFSIQRLSDRNFTAMSRRVSLLKIAQNWQEAEKRTKQGEAEILRSGFPFLFRKRFPFIPICGATSPQ
jgi:hypothetical protein